jgi:hypothetical protein
MFLLTEFCPEEHGMMPCGITLEVFDTMVHVAIQSENNFQFKANCMRAWSKTDNVAEKSLAKQEQQQ